MYTRDNNNKFNFKCFLYLFFPVSFEAFMQEHIDG